MHLIDAAGNVANAFSDGNPYTTPKTEGTVADAAWLNMLQEELKAFLDATGRTPVKGSNGQVLAAVLDLIAQGSQRRRLHYTGARTGSTSLEVLGHTAPTASGTLAFEANARGPWLKCTTVTPSTTPEDIGVAGPYDALQRRWDPDWLCKVDTQTVTGCRLWIGLFSASPAALTTPSSISCVGFRYENGTDGSLWRTCSSDGSNATVKASTYPIATSSSYELRVRHVGSGKFEYLINGSLVATHDPALGDYVPAASTNLGPVALLRHFTDSNSKDFRFGFWRA